MMQGIQEALPCECGEWWGERCYGVLNPATAATVEFMPEQYRDSHTAAGNRGQWPENGASRITVTPECADSMRGHDPLWVRGQ